MGCAASVSPAPVEGLASAAAGAATSVAAAVHVAAVGACLYDVAKVLPFVAPLAMAVGAVAYACKEATRLKGDCRTFAVVAEEIEATLVENKATLESHKAAIEEIQDVLEEAVAYIKALQKANRFSRIGSASFSRGQLADCRNRLLTLLAAITASRTARLAELREMEFEEEKALIAYVESQGGYDAILADDTKKEELSGMLDNSDRLMMALADDAKADRERMLTTLEAKLESQRTMIAESKATQELIAMQNQVLQAQVAQMAAILEQTTMRMGQFMDRFPIPNNEPERLLAIQRLGLHPDLFTENVPEFEEWVDGVLARPGVFDVLSGVVISMVYDELVLHFCARATTKRGAKDYVACPEPIRIARKATPCQYITATGQIECMTDSESAPFKHKWFNDAAPAAFATQKKAGAAMQAMMAMPEMQLVMAIMGGKMAYDDAVAKAESDGLKVDVVRYYASSLVPEVGDRRTFRGYPILVEGHNVGVACAFMKIPDGVEEADFDSEPNAAKIDLDGIFKEAGELLGKVAADRRSKAALRAAEWTTTA